MADLVEVVNGVLLPKLTPERWEYLKTYSLRPDDVFIVTSPKNGTTWTQQIVRLLRNKGEGDGQRIDVAVPWLEMLYCAFKKQFGYNVAMETALPSPRTFKSHLPYSLVPGGLPHTTQAKYIYVARNPKDTLVSVWHHKNRMIMPGVVKDSWEDFLSSILSGKSGLYGDWFDHVLAWWKHKDEENILFLKYEDMKKDLSQSVRTISHFIGIEDATSELIDKVVEQSSFSSMSQDPTTNYSWYTGKLFTAEGAFMRKGVVGDWKFFFSCEQNASFDKIYQEKMEGSGLDFDFE